MDKLKKMYIIRTRQLGINDLVFALRSKRTSYSSLEAFEEAGLVYDLKPEWERDLVKTLVETHPTYEKNFEHFLIAPPNGITPSEVLTALQNRSDLVPTLFVVYIQKDKPTQIEKVQDYYQLLSLLSDAREDGLVSEGDIDPIEGGVDEC